MPIGSSISSSYDDNSLVVAYESAHGRWMMWTLLLAGVYNLLWGAFAVIAPDTMLHWFNMPPPHDRDYWQCIGMMVSVLGVGYVASAPHPIRYWPIVLVGVLGKGLAVAGFINAAIAHRMPWTMGWMVLANHVVWLIPFSLILFTAYEYRLQTLRVTPPELQELALRVKSNTQETLLAMSRKRPVMLVFLRHLGCTFCRETLNDLAAQRLAIEANGVTPILVHMATEEYADRFFERYGLSDLARVSDTRQTLYRAFGLARGRIMQLFGPKFMYRQLAAGFKKGQWSGPIVGDSFQMPGVYIIYHGHVIRNYIHQSVADRPNYQELSAVGTMSDTY